MLDVYAFTSNFFAELFARISPAMNMDLLLQPTKQYPEVTRL
jgi:hypothetical protein